MSEAVIQSIVAGIVAIVLAYIARKVVTIESTGKATHILVNSNFGVQLKLNAIVSRRLAVFSKDPEDERAATLAEKLYEEHMEKQAIVDTTQK